jgi:chemotaxis protein MotA
VDIGSIGGILFALGCILGGQAIEGGHAGSLLQATAAIIVIGGTMGACAVAFPLKDFLGGLKKGGSIGFKNKKHDWAGLMDQILDLAGVARRDGVLALEQKLASIKDPFLKRAVGFIVDGVDAQVARDALETEIQGHFEEGTISAKVWESAGGYSPTVGILGAVLGLIHVMENLSDPSKLGGGIATAFVATVYGVACANLLFLPLANKIKRKLNIEKEIQTMVAEGILSIQAGLNPRVLEEKLRAYAGHNAPKKKPEK